ncbi:twin-arginine translocase TatA/TatE family subunit [Candidatus Bathyarchaeota archaeon]|nr:MAG: hypothetical protein AUJ07_04350 [Crenarchaeota archaeon 13_1_40CM_3_53_5]TMI23470.1 MAG: twin-arginine translocase TatA/TatE family subunit [Candidatus Bathyarchaeota archaeon]TMI29882.1 MAG: twin-arginine translocase TatA/TatE family subunit [Candidatus Bathyarchaeota archaeon]
MAITGYEWVIIGVIVLAIFIWGPNKIPEVARSLGRARKEFDEAAKGLSSAGIDSTPRIENGSSDPLIDTARKLGIATEGKTRREISDEIVKAAQSK